MANRLRMAVVRPVIEPLKQDWSYRRIPRALEVHREAAAQYDCPQPTKRVIPPAGRRAWLQTTARFRQTVRWTHSYASKTP